MTAIATMFAIKGAVIYTFVSYNYQHCKVSIVNTKGRNREKAFTFMTAKELVAAVFLTPTTLRIALCAP